MIELAQLRHLAAFHQSGTLSQAAEELHISQPALSRSMQKLEEELQVPLFERQKNKIRLNANGQMAVEHAQRILEDVKEMAEQVRALDRRSHTIALGNCAPAPGWSAVPVLSNLYPGMTISSEVQEIPQLIDGLRDGTYQIRMRWRTKPFIARLHKRKRCSFACRQSTPVHKKSKPG